MEMMIRSSIKPVVWIGSSRSALASFPEDVKDAIGYALYIARRGGKHEMPSLSKGLVARAF